MSQKTPGYSLVDYTTPYAKYYTEAIQAIPDGVADRLHGGPAPTGSLPAFTDVTALRKPGYLPVETGYTLESNGDIHVAIHTLMPAVTPAMIDWWFGWHGSKANRYKLWHPKAHLHAEWADGKDDIAYIGRTSLIDEYIGEELLNGAIQFTSPTLLGFTHDDLKDPGQVVYICARVGHATLPVDMGWLVHQVRAVEGGAEMRSRFWMGGPYLQLRKEGVLAGIASKLLRQFKNPSEQFARDLLTHCSEEMNHLASFLPQLYAHINGKHPELKVEGRIITQTDNEFDQILMDSLFNKVDPGRRPCKIVEPTSVQDIIATVRHARSTGKKITVCSGGHSWSANHLRNDSILIMMGGFNQYEINAQAMTAKAGPGVGGSVLMGELFKQNLFFPAGHCKGVCIGGYLLQGGYGWNGRKTGIACQSITGYDMVTADGEFVHASETENADLFWAARGAGDGFFGVVTCFYLKLFALPKYRAIIVHDFYMKHLEAVYNWAYEVGPAIPKAVEFQMIMSNRMLNLFGPGIEAIAPVFADTEDEFQEAINFMKNSPIKHKALIATPAIDPGIDALYKGTMMHYPDNHYWGVDNMWTHAPIDDLMPFIQEIARTLPPAPSHFLWLNWHPGSLSDNMAYSKEDAIYLALYATWKSAADTAKYGDWAAHMMQKMAHLSTGIQLADEGLHKRTAPFMSDDHLRRFQAIRAQRDPNAIFHEWHSKPEPAE